MPLSVSAFCLYVLLFCGGVSDCVVSFLVLTGISLAHCTGQLEPKSIHNAHCVVSLDRAKTRHLQCPNLVSNRTLRQRFQFSKGTGKEKRAVFVLIRTNGITLVWHYPGLVDNEIR